MANSKEEIKNMIQQREKMLEGKDDFASKVELANNYFHGEKTEKDYSKAIYFLEKVVSHIFPEIQSGTGHDRPSVSQDKLSDAQYKLSKCYFEGGFGIDKNITLAIEWLRKAADNGNKLAQGELVDYYFQEDKGEQDKKEEFLSLEKLIQPSNLIHFPHCNCSDEDNCNRKSYQPPNRHNIALYKFATCYFYGYGVEKDYLEAFKWFKEAEKTDSPIINRHGFSPAQVALGILYFKGYGVEKNNDEAIKLFEKSLINGNTVGNIWIAYIKNIEYTKKLEDPMIINQPFLFPERITATWAAKATEDELDTVIKRNNKLHDLNEIKTQITTYLNSATCNFFIGNKCFGSMESIVNDYYFSAEILDFLRQERIVILGLYYKYIGETDQSIDCFERASSEGDIIALRELGEFYKEERLFDKSINYFDVISNNKYSSLYGKDTFNRVWESSEKEISVIKTFLKYEDELNKKNNELNNLIAMFAHNFLGTLQCIRSNAEHENNSNIHLKTVKMMGGALTAFSIISADDDKLVKQLKQDNTGETNLSQCLANNLALAILQLLSKTNKDKIINLYLNYLQKTAQISLETNAEELRSNKDKRQKWQALQHKWEDDFNPLFSEQLELNALKKWITTHFFAIEIIGFDDYPIHFKEYGITDSIFLVVLMEILVNALKYMDVNANKPLTLTLCKENNAYQLSCENSSQQESGRGTHKGMDFLQTIAKKLNGELITAFTENNFKTTFIIPAELLD